MRITKVGRTLLIWLLLCVPLFADTHTWVGKAADIVDVYTITIAGTWADTETVTVTIDDQDLILTLGSTSAGTTALVADALHDAYNATSKTDAINSDESRNFGGQEVPQFAELTSTVSGSVVTLTANTAGKPHAVSVSETAASGTATLSQVQTATGRHFWSNADNWTPSGPPAAGDSVIFKDSDVDCKYGLPTENFEPPTFTVKQSYTGGIGLPTTNTDSSNNPYPEYRGDRVVIENDAGSSNVPDIIIGEGSGAGPDRVRFEVDGLAADLFVYDSGAAPSTTESNITMVSGDATETLSVVLYKATGGVEINEAAVIDSLLVGYETSSTSDVVAKLVDCGFEGGATATIAGGTLDLDCGFDTTGTFNVYGGTTTLRTTLINMNVYGGTVRSQRDAASAGGTATTIVVTDGTVDFSGETRGWTITNLDLYDGATWRDPNGVNTYTNGIDLEQCRITDVTLDIGVHKTLTLSTP